MYGATGSNWWYGTLGLPMFVFVQGTPLLLSWMVFGTKGTALPLGSADLYQACYDYDKKGSFDYEKFMLYVQHCVIAAAQHTPHVLVHAYH